jgi:hypothetical protein
LSQAALERACRAVQPRQRGPGAGRQPGIDEPASDAEALGYTERQQSSVNLQTPANEEHQGVIRGLVVCQYMGQCTATKSAFELRNPAELVRTLNALVADLLDTSEEILVLRLSGECDGVPTHAEVGTKSRLT